jgi:2-polyprenyl-3-methyl-5-hydroxy-6-metoxy-1,4-benzoquinol methylase
MTVNVPELNHNYFSLLRTPLAQLIKSQPQAVLEVGCGSGRLLAYCKQTLKSKLVVGIELNEQAAAVATARPEIDAIFVGDIERSQFPIEEESMDLLVASHVLEHMADPWSVLHKISQWVRPGGQIVIGLPNARHVNLTVPLLLKGHMQYVDSGILDRTHLRFFTRSSMI